MSDQIENFESNLVPKESGLSSIDIDLTVEQIPKDQLTSSGAIRALPGLELVDFDQDRLEVYSVANSGAQTKSEKSAELADAMAELINSKFDEIDANGNGRLTADEVNAYKENSGAERTATEREALDNLAKAAKIGPFSALPDIFSWFRPGLNQGQALVWADFVRAGVRLDRK